MARIYEGVQTDKQGNQIVLKNYHTVNNYHHFVKLRNAINNNIEYEILQTTIVLVFQNLSLSSYNNGILIDVFTVDNCNERYILIDNNTTQTPELQLLKTNEDYCDSCDKIINDTTDSETCERVSEDDDEIERYKHKQCMV